MKILYAVSEASPFIKTGGLADVAGSLPSALKKQGCDVRVILPLYEDIGGEWREKMQFVMYTYVFLAWRRQYCGLFKLELDGITYYFVDNEYYFKRTKPYGHYDDGERFGFFSKAVVQLLPLLDFKPDVVHCNDWQTALIPVYLRREDLPFYRDIRTVFTIHNIEYQGRYGKEVMWELFGLPMELYSSGIMEYSGDVNILKAAIYMADWVTTVSPSYAEELKTAEHGCGLHDIIAQNGQKLTGILNGIDVKRYDPETDESICQRFSADAPEGKVKNKLALQSLLGLRKDENVPLVACVSRLVRHKGFDMVLEALPRIMEENVELIILGSGDWALEEGFKAAQSRYPGTLSVNIMYSEPLSAQIYAGADIFLMPSRSEPCGLAQMMAMRYGTLPLVRETGGLRDTVIPYPMEGSNGFTFRECNTNDMLYVLKKAASLYADRAEWGALRRRAMLGDYTWDASAKKYMEVYETVEKIHY